MPGLWMTLPLLSNCGPATLYLETFLGYFSIHTKLTTKYTTLQVLLNGFTTDFSATFQSFLVGPSRTVYLSTSVFSFVKRR